jgi:hypothetical protein
LCAALALLAGCAATQRTGGGGVELAGAGNVVAPVELETLQDAMVGVVNTVDESRQQNDTWSLRLAIGGVVAMPLIYPLGKLLWLLVAVVSRRFIGSR